MLLRSLKERLGLASQVASGISQENPYWAQASVDRVLRGPRQVRQVLAMISVWVGHYLVECTCLLRKPLGDISGARKKTDFG